MREIHAEKYPLTDNEIDIRIQSELNQLKTYQQPPLARLVPVYFD